MEQNKPFGVPKQEGVDTASYEQWRITEAFILSKVWWLQDPCTEEDKLDPLTAPYIPFGAFMLGFDFHLTKSGPKLIEINTNAGGLATVFTFHATECFSTIEMAHIQNRFILAVKDEYQTGKNYLRAQYADSSLPQELQRLVIVDDDVERQVMFKEMIAFRDLLETNNIHAHVVSPEDLELGENDELLVNGERVDFVYNRITPDFRLKNTKYQHIRKAAIAGQIVLSPHPATYARVADKRGLSIIREKLAELVQSSPSAPVFADVIPVTKLMKDEPIEYWLANKKHWVFKPADGNASRGVYRGDKVSASKLRSLPIDVTIAQEYCEPSSNPDGTKHDFRVFTRDSFILGLATRHYSGQVMEMGSAKSGFKMILPESICCFPVLVKDVVCSAPGPDLSECFNQAQETLKL